MFKLRLKNSSANFQIIFRMRKVDAAHRIIKENFRKKQINANTVRDKNAKALTESRNRVSWWVEYIESLYKSDVVADLIKIKMTIGGDSILKEEFKKH